MIKMTPYPTVIFHAATTAAAQVFIGTSSLRNHMEDKGHPPPEDKHSHPGSPNTQYRPLPRTDYPGMGRHLNTEFAEARDNTLHTQTHTKAKGEAL